MIRIKRKLRGARCWAKTRSADGTHLGGTREGVRWTGTFCDRRCVILMLAVVVGDAVMTPP